MAFAYFVSEEYLKENTPLDSNVDPKVLRMAMREAQEVFIRDIIGSGLYNELCDQINADTLSTDNENLLVSYIRPCQKYYILYDSAHALSFQLVNKGVVTRNSDFQQPADIQAITTLMNSWKDKAEYYAQRIREFLLENITTYPLYQNPGSGVDTIHPKGTQVFGGFYLGGSEDNCFTYDKPT